MHSRTTERKRVDSKTAQREDKKMKTANQRLKIKKKVRRNITTKAGSKEKSQRAPEGGTQE